MGEHSKQVDCSVCNGKGKVSIGQQWHHDQGQLHSVQGDGQSVSDRLECPDCGGSGHQWFGLVNVRCLFCRGLGYVGDDNEPAERGADDGAEVHPLEADPVGEQLDARALPGCAVCFGAGTVLSLGGDVRGGVPTKMVRLPCPECSAGRS
jgi:RecJ-like exonuclease